MGKAVSDQINFNTVLLMIVGALVTLGVNKADRAYTMIVQLQQHEEDLTRRVDNIETVLGVFAPNGHKKPNQPKDLP